MHFKESLRAMNLGYSICNSPGKPGTEKAQDSGLMTNRENRVSSLVESAKAGNRNDLEQLVNLFHKDIFRMVCCRTRSQMDAEDLTQEIFIQMMKSLPGLRDVRRFRSWLFRIALNRVRDFYRKKNILEFFGTSADVDDACRVPSEKRDGPLEKVAQKEFWQQFHQFSDTLSRWEKEVFLLRFADHLGIREIAETLEKNESTVKTHLYRALKKFRNNTEFHRLLKGGTL